MKKLFVKLVSMAVVVGLLSISTTSGASRTEPTGTYCSDKTGSYCDGDPCDCAMVIIATGPRCPK